MGNATELVNAIASGETTAVAATNEAIKRIEDGDGEINAVVVRDFDPARAQAQEADARIARGERAPLLGLPMTVKESINIAGLPTTWGFTEYADSIAEHDAVLATRLKRAGAVIVGKTNIPPGLADLQSVNPVYGATHNPHMHGRSSGGSSGGAAASLAAGFVSAEVGSDIGGSIRTPAAFCGVWGLKPTHGVISKAGHSMPGTDGADDVLSVVGPMATSAEDLDLLLGVLADHPLPAPSESELTGMRVAVLASHPLAPMSSDVAAALESRAAALESLGAIVDRTPTLPDLTTMHGDYLRLLNTVMLRGAPPPDRPPVTLEAYLSMLDSHARTHRAWDAALSEQYDAVLAPVFGTTAFPLDEASIATRMIDIDGRSEPCAAQLAWAGLAIYPGLPSVSFPAGKGSDGLPIGLQLMGPRFADREVLRIASQIAI